MAGISPSALRTPQQILCHRCEAELTSADADAGACTQCHTKLRLTRWDWEKLRRYEHA